jgi:pimeloyl-ACP methyl ester carboxylesterase
MRADVDTVLKVIDERLGSKLPMIPVGLSFGGAAAVHVAATRSSTAGLVLWYAVVDYEWNYGAQSPVPFTRQMRAASQAGSPRWSEMPILTTAYHFPSAMLEEFKSDKTAETFSRLTVPVLCYHGSRDRFVSVNPVSVLAASRPNIDLRVAYGAGHGFLLWRPWVVRRTVSWAARVAREAQA